MKRVAWALALLVGGCSSKEEPTLHLLTWPDYFAKDTQAGFEKEFGCRVKIDYVENSEDYRTKVAGGKSGFDVIVPSDEVVADLIGRGLLERLDPAKLPNLKNIAAKYRGLPYDAKNEYSVPYMWGTTGIAYNKEKVSPAPDSWAVIWNPKPGGGATMLNDKREAFAAAMRLDGSFAKGMTAETIKAAAKRFEGWKPRAYESSPKEMLVNGDAVVAQCYNGDALQAASGSNGKIAFVIPKEGGTLWLDNLAIARGAPLPDLAHKFIDYLLRPEVSAAITNERFFGNPNEAAAKLIKKEVLENRVVYPSEEDQKRLALLPVISADIKKELDSAWAAIRGK
jgi:spermidine/putrescine transport system substrate-binding protein